MERLKPGEVFNKVGLAMCILVGFVMYVQILVMIPVELLKPEWVESTKFLMALTDVSYYLCAFPVFVFFMSTFEREVVIEKKKLGFGKFLACFFICFAAMNLSNYITIFFNWFVERTSGIKLGGALDDVFDGVDGMVVLTTVVLAPIFEELTFRYFALNKLRRFGDKTAIILTAVMFGLFHMNFEQGIYATAIGIVFGYVACKTGRIRYTIMLHALINFFGGVVPMLLDEINTPICELVYGVGYILFIVTGIILLIINVPKIRLEKGREPLQNPVKTAILNPGILIFMIFCVLAMVVTLASEFLTAIIK